ncbi:MULTISPECIES: hypothetical protein [unclassified Oleiphilus]|uniref:hypothetical protein n=1 Tax=unclassified Oleiphilus TaxID=2631174 RepID=UPI0012E78058|nr:MULTISPECIES: hypothetical protein [unclassified Oleiphilus]
MNIVSGGFWLAPAFLVAAYALAQSHMEIVQQALTVMAGAVGVMVVVVLLESVGRRLLGLRYGE